MSVSDVKVLEEFESKSRWLEMCPYFELSEVYLSEFIELIFNRFGVSDSNEVCPFEDIQSFEYRYWLDQKKRKSLNSDESCSVIPPSVEGKIDYSGYRMWRYNPIVFCKEDGKNSHRLLLKDDDEMLAWLESRKFAIMSPVTYVGRTCTYSNARYLYAFGIDLDGVLVSDIDTLLWRMSVGQRPTANIIVNSGHGVHVYFLLERPVEMYESNIKLLNKLKAGLTKIVWLVSRDDNPQIQSVVQGFRLPGTLTKFGQPIRAFWNKDAKPYTLEELNKFAHSEYKLTEDELAQLAGKAPYNPSRVTLKEAEEKWPEWYANRVIGHKRVTKTWKLHRGLYDWWLNTIKENGADKVTEHHRYWCILTLVVYAVKCGIPKDEVLKDALALVPLFDTKTQTNDNNFTDDDVMDAMKAYDANYNTWPIKTIETTTAIRIERNRRNGREQAIHLRRIRMLQEADYPNGTWREHNGRKDAEFEVQRWQNFNPENGDKNQCAKETELSLPTVRKWWVDNDSRCAAIVKEWQRNHPNSGDKSLCASETGLSLPTIRKWWIADDSRCAAIVRGWKCNNPDNENKSQCARETNLARKTVIKWWNG